MLSRFTAHPLSRSGVFFDRARIDNKAINGAEQFHVEKRKRKEKFNIYRGDNGFYNPL